MYNNLGNYTSSLFEKILLFNSLQMLFNNMKELSVFSKCCVKENNKGF